MDENIQDVEFSEVKEDDKQIRGKILYFSTSQVAQSLNVADSKIRYYTSVFDEILNIQISNKQRQYTDKDIQKLKFIIELKSSGMTIKQIQEYCEEVSFDEHTGIQIKETNPLSIQTLAKALMDEQHKQMLEFKKEIIDAVAIQLSNQINIINSNNDELKDKIVEQVALTIDNIIDDKLVNVMETQEEVKQLHQKNQEELKDFVSVTLENSIKLAIDSIEQSNTKQLLEKEDLIRQRMEEKKKHQQLVEEMELKYKNKTFLQRIFNK